MALQSCCDAVVSGLPHETAIQQLRPIRVLVLQLLGQHPGARHRCAQPPKGGDQFFDYVATRIAVPGTTCHANARSLTSGTSFS